MVILIHKHLLCPLLFTLCFSLLIHLSNSSDNNYIKLPLLHNPLNNSQSLSSDLHRLHRHKYPHLPLTSGASSGSGQYFVHLQIGTPPQHLLLVADTGSDLVWVSCSACRNCSAHKPNTSFFPRHSSTFSPHHCYDKSCGLVPHPRRAACNHTRLHNTCRYEYSYSDGSFTSGFFSGETITFNSSSSGNKIKLSFGCGFDISGRSLLGPSFSGAHGVIGLGRGPISLPSQLRRRFGNKFSYCLMDYTLSPPPTSFLLIGNDGASKMSYTPFIINPLSPTFYYIGIQSVYINGVKLPISTSTWSIDQFGNGGTVVDSGTTLTFLPDPAYIRILNVFKKLVKIPSPTESTPGFDFCINMSSVSRLSLPRLSFKLGGNSVFSPPPSNYFIDTAEDVKCLALQPVTLPSFSVFGNLLQQGFLFEFDSDRSRLGFTRRGCAVQ